jgi:hypothetical protein
MDKTAAVNISDLSEHKAYYRWLPQSIREQVQAEGMAPNPATGNPMHFWDNEAEAQRYGEIVNSLEPHDLWAVHPSAVGNLKRDPWFGLVRHDWGDKPGAWQSDAIHIAPSVLSLHTQSSSPLKPLSTTPASPRSHAHTRHTAPRMADMLRQYLGSNTTPHPITPDTSALSSTANKVHSAPEAELPAPQVGDAYADRFKGVQLREDEDGWYVGTRGRSKSYPSPEDIPDSVVQKIRAQGWKPSVLGMRAPLLEHKRASRARSQPISEAVSINRSPDGTREASTRSLYHGTLIDHLPSIQQWGLQPGIGDFTQDAYGVGDEMTEDMLDPAVYMTDKFRMDRALTAMRHNVGRKLDKDFHDVTPLDIRNHGLLVKSPGGMGWSDDPRSDNHLQLPQRADDDITHEPWFEDESISSNDPDWGDDVPKQTEPGDYFDTSKVGPEGLKFIHGPALMRVLQRHNQINKGVFANRSPKGSHVGGTPDGTDLGDSWNLGVPMGTRQGNAFDPRRVRAAESWKFGANQPPPYTSLPSPASFFSGTPAVWTPKGWYITGEDISAHDDLIDHFGLDHESIKPHHRWWLDDDETWVNPQIYQKKYGPWDLGSHIKEAAIEPGTRFVLNDTDIDTGEPGRLHGQEAKYLYPDKSYPGTHYVQLPGAKHPLWVTDHMINHKPSYYHLAPTSERARIMAHGLKAGDPSFRNSWLKDGPNANNVVGVYATREPERANELADLFPKEFGATGWDIWKIRHPNTPQVDNDSGHFVFPHDIEPQHLSLRTPWEANPVNRNGWPERQFAEVSDRGDAIQQSQWEMQDYYNNGGRATPTKRLPLLDMERVGMAADPYWLDNFIERNGPIVYHHTNSEENAQNIAQNGLIPWDHPANPSGALWDGVLQPRPNHVYLTSHQPRNHSIDAPHRSILEVDLRKLDPRNLNPDEDAIDFAGLDRHMNVNLERDEPWHIQERGEHSPMTRGEWFDQLPGANDPSNTAWSMENNETIAHRGIISPEAIRYPYAEHMAQHPELYTAKTAAEAPFGLSEWRPGRRGKGLVTPSGMVYTWNVNAQDAPHHIDAVQRGKIPMRHWEGASLFAIDPSGQLDVFPQHHHPSVITSEVPGTWVPEAEPISNYDNEWNYAA